MMQTAAGVDEKTPIESPFRNAIQNSTDYSAHVLGSSRLEYVSVIPEVGAANVVLDATGIQESRFKIPAGGYVNLSKCYLKWDLDVGAPGANLMTKMWVHKPPISMLKVETASGLVLCEIQDFQYYWMMTRGAIPYEQYRDNGVLGLSTTSANAAANSSLLQYHHPSGRASTITLATNAVSNVTKLTSAGAATVPAIVKDSDTQCVIVSQAVDTALGAKCQISFDQLPFTILSNPHLFPLSEQLVITINWAPKSGVVFVSDSLTDPASNAAAIAAGSAVTFSAVHVGVAYERNPTNTETLAAIVKYTEKDEKTGVVTPIGLDYYFCQPKRVSKKAVAASTTDFANSASIGQGNLGFNLLHLFCAEFLSSETVNTAYNAYNVGGTKVSAARHTLGNQPLENSSMDLTKMTDWSRIRSLYEDSAVDRGDYYSVCPAYVINFSGITKLSEFNKLNNNMISGIPIDGRAAAGVSTIDFVRTITNGAFTLNSFIYAVGQNKLKILPGTITLENGNAAPVITQQPGSY